MCVCVCVCVCVCGIYITHECWYALSLTKNHPNYSSGLSYIWMPQPFKTGVALLREQEKPLNTTSPR